MSLAMRSQPSGLHIGVVAPEFSLPDHHGRQVSLSDFRGRRVVVLVFYPYAFTRTCTGELRAIQDVLPTFQSDDVQVLGVSCDSMFALRVFAEQQRLGYPLLSDFWPHGEVARAYGVFDEERGAAVRGTFVVDRAGVLRWQVVSAIPDARDIADYERVLERILAA